MLVEKRKIKIIFVIIFFVNLVNSEEQTTTK